MEGIVAVNRISVAKLLNKTNIMNKETQHSNKNYPAQTREERQNKSMDEYDDTAEKAAVRTERTKAREEGEYTADNPGNRPEDSRADKRFDEV